MGYHTFDLTDAKDTALHIAAMNGHLPMVEHLIKTTGFDVKDKNKVCTPLQLWPCSVSLLYAYLLLFYEMTYVLDII